MNLVIYLVNFVMLILIIRFEYSSGNDKSVIISSLAVLVIVILNLITGLIKQLDKKTEFKHYYISALGVVLTFMILLFVE